MANSIENRDYRMDILKTAFSEDELRKIIEKTGEYAKIQSELDEVVGTSETEPYADIVKSVEYDKDEVDKKRRQLAEIYDQKMREAIDIALKLTTEDGLNEMRKKQRSELENNILEALEAKKSGEVVLENKETESQDSIDLGNSAKAGIEALGNNQKQVAEYLTGECYRLLSKNVSSKSLGLVEEFAEKLKLAGEVDEAQELIDKIKSVIIEQAK